MTATALHPSEITFTCPSWCRMTREEHLEELSEHQGQCIHRSPDRNGTSGEGRSWAVSLSSMTFPDGTISDDEGVLVEVYAPNCNLTPGEARELVQAINTATAEASR
jgi:hypothetical protein